jgi:hypothetical protein
VLEHHERMRDGADARDAVAPTVPPTPAQPLARTITAPTDPPLADPMTNGSASVDDRG